MDDNAPSNDPQNPAAPEAPPPSSASQPPIQASAEPPALEAPPRPMFAVKCTRCEAAFEVPFNPDPTRPLLCRTCRPVFPAKCATCGLDFEVPFRPAPNRPFYCRTCFAKRSPATGGREQQEKPKDPVRQAAKDAIRATWKEVGDREPTHEEALHIAGLCKVLYGPESSQGKGSWVFLPRAVGAQPIAAGATDSPSAAGSKPAPASSQGARRATLPVPYVKVALPIKPEQLPRYVLSPDPGVPFFIEVTIKVADGEGKPTLPIRALINSKNYRRAVKAIDEAGGNVMVIIQGQLTGNGELLGTGIAVQPKEAARTGGQEVPIPNEVTGASAKRGAAAAPSAPSPEKKTPAPPFVVRPGECIGRWTVLHESLPRGGVRQIHCRCKKCGFRTALGVDELLAPVLPLCRRCE